jgi:hypothetical protein
LDYFGTLKLTLFCAGDETRYNAKKYYIWHPVAPLSNIAEDAYDKANLFAIFTSLLEHHQVSKGFWLA